MTAAARRSQDDYLLLDYQRDWVYDKSNVKVCEKGRQEGYTWATALDAIMAASKSKTDGGSDVWFMTTSQADAREFVEDNCVPWLSLLAPRFRAGSTVDAFDWVDPEDKDDSSSVLTYRITFPSGHAIHALPSRPARLRGRKGYAICDEAAQQDLVAWRRAAGGLLMWGGRLAIISTHHGADNAFYSYVQQIKRSRDEGKPIASLHSVFLDDALEQGLYRRICRMQRPTPTPWTKEGEEAWVEDLRRQYGEFFDEECRGIIAGGTSRLIARPLILAAQTLGPSECPIIEIMGGDSPRLWVNGDLIDSAPSAWPNPSDQSQERISDPAARQQVVRLWLDQYIAPHLRRVNDLGLDIHVGDDYGRTLNISTKIIGTNDRSNKQAVRMVIECESVPWTVQDQISDYCWQMLTRLRSGSGDGNGNGSASAERAKEMTRSKMACTMRLPDSAFTRLRNRLEDGTIALPRHSLTIVDDLASLRREGGKISAPERTTTDHRRQRRHADAAYALAHFQHSIEADGQVVPITTKRHRSLFPAPRRPMR